MTEEQILQIYKVVVTLIAFYVGIFGAFFTDKFIELNSRAFKKIGFQNHAEEFQKPYMYWLAKLLGTFFLIVGISIVVESLTGFVIIPIDNL